MKDIKFRIWIPELKRLCEVTSIDIAKQCVVYKINGGDLNYPLTLEYLMQYTGVYDLNGVEIYEGDIVLNNTRKYIGKACYYALSAKYLLRDKSNKYIQDFGDFIWINELKIIGNIYENPEVLELSLEELLRR